MPICPVPYATAVRPCIPRASTAPGTTRVHLSRLGAAHTGKKKRPRVFGPIASVLFSARFASANPASPGRTMIFRHKGTQITIRPDDFYCRLVATAAATATAAAAVATATAAAAATAAAVSTAAAAAVAASATAA